MDFSHFVGAIPNEILGGIVKALTGTLGEKYGNHKLEFGWDKIERNLNRTVRHIRKGLTYRQIVNLEISRGGIHRSLWRSIDKSIRDNVPDERMINGMLKIIGRGFELRLTGTKVFKSKKKWSVINSSRAFQKKNKSKFLVKEEWKGSLHELAQFVVNECAVGNYRGEKMTACKEIAKQYTYKHKPINIATLYRYTKGKKAG